MLLLSVCSSLVLYLVWWFKWSSLVSQLSIDRRFPSVILHLVILAAKKEKSPLIVHYSSLHPLSVSAVNESPASRCSQMRRQSHKDRRKAGVGGKYIVKWHRLRTEWSWRPDRHFVFQGEPGFIGCCVCNSQPCQHSNFHPCLKQLDGRHSFPVGVHINCLWVILCPAVVWLISFRKSQCLILLEMT